MLRFYYRIFTCWALLIFSAHATNLALSPVPIYLGGSVEPNIMFTLDDSGSMHWEYMPSDGWTYFVFPRATNVYGTSDYDNWLPTFSDTSYSVRTRSSHINKVYYNPAVTYIPWSADTGVSMGNVSITCAPHNPVDTAKGCRNLTTTNTQTATWDTYNGNGTTFPGSVATEVGVSKSFWPAVYYNYGAGDEWTVASFQKVEIRTSTLNYTGSANREDCAAAPTCTYAEEIQNFANWYSYYRSRILTARAGVGRAFAKQSTNMRVGFAAINQGSTTIDGVASDGAMIQGVRGFSGADRTGFFTNLYGHAIPTSGTPLRSALSNVGSYYQRSDDSGPWSETPGTTNAADHLACRQSYNILMTDGYWNGSDPTVANSDNTDGSVISGPENPNFQYLATNPYKDTWSNTLADVGMDYWKRDLRTDLVNEVPTNSVDDAFWQHMVNFTVGLGVDGSLDPLTALPGLTDGSTLWPDPAGSDLAKIDDLWHASVNSRGEFFSATDPDAFAESLAGVLSSISDRTSSASSVALNSGTVSGSSKLYQARFDSGDWSGQLIAFPVNLDGSLGSQVWDAADLIGGSNSRTIITHDGSQGQPFDWDFISAAQKTLLGQRKVLKYLRGAQGKEVSRGGTFRNRNTRLGDIVHSSPIYVGAPSFRYSDYWGSGAAENSVLYSSFKTTNASRQALIYVGANDGMLHAFNADTGREKFAYVPNAVYENLADLADVNYNHKYYVDGSATVVDVFFDSEWHSVLVSGLAGGGQGVFALDVTDPTDFDNETTAATKVLWEFTDSDDADLGYVFGTPSIVRLNNGKWAAVFSGGYNNTFDDDGDGSSNDSSTGDAVLFIIDIEDGSVIKKLTTKVGTAEDPTGNARPNGLSPPSVVDLNGDNIVDAIYAGDLFGNVWKMDITGNVNTWKFSYKSGSNPVPIYTACAATTCTASNHQAITTQLQIINHPNLTGYLALFGTGKYLEVGDNSTSGQTTQSFYGIWDKAESSLTSFERDDLLQQEITKETIKSGYDVRITTDNEIAWHNGSTGHLGWYLDLFNTQGGNTNNYGERQISNSIVRNGRIVFTTLLPSDEPCDFGGSGWIMELDVNSGSRLSFSPFDLDGDRAFNINDYVNIGDIDGDGIDDYVPVSGKKSKVGIIPTPSITNASGGDEEYKYTSGSTGAIEKTVENPGPMFNGRQSWRQLDFNF